MHEHPAPGGAARRNPRRAMTHDPWQDTCNRRTPSGVAPGAVVSTQESRMLSRARRAFTLLELVVVLAILATLAGLVISQVSMLGRSTDMAASAKTQADIANNLQLFFVLQKRFPQNMDSLLES